MEKKYTTFKDKQEAQDFIINVVKKMSLSDQKDAAILVAGFALAKENNKQQNSNYWLWNQIKTTFPVIRKGWEIYEDKFKS